MRERRELVAKLAEYGLLISLLYKGLLTTSTILYFIIASGVLTYTIILREPGGLGKAVLMSIILLLSSLLSWIPRPTTPPEQVKTKKRARSQPEVSTRILVAVVVLVILTICYVLTCIYRAY